MPEGLEEIGYWAFYACYHLESLAIPRSVKHIGYGIVSAHKGFEGVVCHAKDYHVENDALIDDTKKTLLCCWTEQKHYVVPECVDKIASISDNPYVETITVRQPVELTTVDVFAFDSKRLIFKVESKVLQKIRSTFAIFQEKLKFKHHRFPCHLQPIIKQGGISENDAVLLNNSIAIMCMPKQMVTRLYLKDAITQRSIAPVGS